MKATAKMSVSKKAVNVDYAVLDLSGNDDEEEEEVDEEEDENQNGLTQQKGHQGSPTKARVKIDRVAFDQKAFNERFQV